MRDADTADDPTAASSFQEDEGAVEDAFSDVREATHVEERAEIAALVAQVVATEGESSLTSFPRLKQILDRYQEQSQLLDPVLEGLISPLVGLLRALARRVQGMDASGEGGAPEEVRAALQRAVLVARLLNAVVTVRGYKTALRFFGHEAADLEPTVNLLQWAEREDSLGEHSIPIPPPVAETGGGLWEVKRVLLLWLSILILIPFDLATVDSTVLHSRAAGEGAAAARDAAVPPLVARLLALCRAYLADPGGVREAAAVLLGRLLTRPDMSGALHSFLQWAGAAVLQCEGGVRAPFLLCGATQALSCVFKVGQRSTLLSSVPAVWPLALTLAESSEGGGEGQGQGQLSLPLLLARNALARKLAIKLLQRVGLVLMEPRVASWRYRKGGANLLANLGAAAGAAGGEGEEEEGEEDDVVLEGETADRAEELMGCLLSALRDRDTVVRWSAAKGLGRAVNRLPRAFGEDVVQSILEMFSPSEPDTAWHGACLALAELCRRGLLLPGTLGGAAPLVAKALAYDVRRGAHSVGSHVRDAAAYCCWAFARAYSPAEVAGAVHHLAPALLVTACYDREVNCRRAASAAFQECAGRLGNFPHGIEILTAADYFALSVRAHAYLEVAPFIAQFDEYKEPLSRHLIEVKLRHWDPSVRSLAARALAALVPSNPQYFAGDALDVLLPWTIDPVLEVRHGATLGLAELTRALRPPSPAPSPIPIPALTQERETALSQVVVEIEKHRLYRGKGGEAMRAAVGRFIECAATADPPLALDFATRRAMMNTLDENLKHPTGSIQEAAVRALAAFTRAFMREEKENFVARTTAKYLGLLGDPNPAARRGYTAALGCLPLPLLRPRIDAVIEALLGATRPEENPEEQDAESRVAAVTALSAICREVFSPAADAFPPPTPESESEGPTWSRVATGLDVILVRVVPALLMALGDYSTDKRGDVGSWVREASMRALAELLPLATGLAVTSGDPDSLRQVGDAAAPAAAAMLKQMVERIGRVRECGAASLTAILTHSPAIPGIPHRSELEAVFLLPGRPEPLPALLANTEALEELLGLLAPCPAYVSSIAEGLAASIGGLDAALAGKAAHAVSALTVRHGDVFAHTVLTAILGAWARHERSPRLATPVMRCFDLLFTRGMFRAVAADAGFLERLLELARGEVRQCKDVVRLLAAAALMGHVLDAEHGPAAQRALQSLLVLLVNRYPRVRKATAEALYLRLVAVDRPEGRGMRDLEGALDVLGGTAWDGELEKVKAARNALYPLLGVEPPALATREGEAPEGEGEGPRRKKEDRDRLGYQSLLNDAQRGLM